jgi:capsular polysaccharide biosynthesis protein
LFGKLVLTARLPYAKFVFALDQPIVCESLDVPSAPFHVAAAADPRFLNVFERIGKRVQRRRYHGSLSSLPRRVYFSRSRLKVNPRSADKRSADNEVEIEEMLARRGFQTVHTQELPLDEQVALARRAEVIAGCDGSALHLAMFSQPGTRMLALDTRRVPNQFLINRARGIDAVHVWAATEVVLNRMANWTINPSRVNEGLDLLLDEGA